MVEKTIKILHLEDNPADAGLTERVLEKAGLIHQCRVVESEDQFINGLNEFQPDLILSDHSLPSFNSLEAFRIARQIIPDVPFILVTGSVSEEFAVACLKAGADDYILKRNLLRLPSSIEQVFTKRQIIAEKENIEALHNQLQDAYAQIEQKNKEITDSIQYAQRVQQAILPPLSRIHACLPESFIIYKPKDIVAGDFYWFAQRRDMLYIAAADCTGHGVPGAMLSIVCSNALNKIVKEQGIADTGEILDIARDFIAATFAGSEGRVTDGMDISICAINTQTREVCWSGANNSLLYIQDGELKQIRPHRQSVCKTDQPTPFPSHKLKLHAGDKLYLITDGYADQFGGPKGKKLRWKKLQELLNESKNCSPEMQRKVLEDTLEAWKGELEQVDDVTVVGITV